LEFVSQLTAASAYVECRRVLADRGVQIGIARDAHELAVETRATGCSGLTRGEYPVTAATVDARLSLAIRHVDPCVRVDITSVGRFYLGHRRVRVHSFGNFTVADFIGFGLFFGVVDLTPVSDRCRRRIWKAAAETRQCGKEARSSPLRTPRDELDRYHAFPQHS